MKFPQHHSILMRFLLYSPRSWLFHPIKLKFHSKNSRSLLSTQFSSILIPLYIAFSWQFLSKAMVSPLKNHRDSSKWNRRKKNFINQNYWFFNCHSTNECSLFLDLLLSHSSFSIYFYCFSFVLLWFFPFNCSSLIFHLLDGKLFILFSHVVPIGSLLIALAVFLSFYVYLVPSLSISCSSSLSISFSFSLSLTLPLEQNRDRSEKKQGRKMRSEPKRNLKLVIEFKILYLTETVNYRFGC